MSTRFYPRFVKGNPQLRIFLPDWKMVLIKSNKEVPENIVSFKVDPRMTDWDVKNYLEKIYKVEVAAVRSRIFAGPLKRIRESVGLAKGEDYKIVRVSLPIGQKFVWPDLFPKEKEKELEEEYKTTVKEMAKHRKIDTNSKIPSWFA